MSVTSYAQNVNDRVSLEWNVVTIRQARLHLPKFVEFEKDCRTCQKVCREFSCVRVCICKRKQDGIHGCCIKSVTNLSPTSRIWRIRKSLYTQIQVDWRGINFLQIIIRKEIMVSFGDKYINKLLIDVPYGQQDCRPIFSIYPLTAHNGIRSN